MIDPRGAAASPATDAAAALLDELVRAGLEHIVVCPGSRSQALALAAADLERRGRATVHVRIDERSAGFFALGLARQSGLPAAVIVTSGTAVANLLPAVLEAHHSGVPLVLLTADRPPELRGVGANQATDQIELFGSAVRLFRDLPTPDHPDPIGEADHPHRRAARDAWRSAVNVPRGPVHLNVPLREPLAGALPPWWSRGADVVTVHGVDPAADDDVAWGDGAPTLVVAGADATTLAVDAAQRFGWPLVAEIVSGARRGGDLVPDYRSALADRALVDAVGRVVVFGHPTLTREVAALLRAPDIDVVAVRGPGERLNLNGHTRSVAVDTVFAEAVAGDAAWRRTWVDRPVSEPRGTDEGEHGGAIDRGTLVRAVWEASEPEDRVVWASSRLVRVADATLEPRDVTVHANRGLAGIDGLIATACGVAAAASDGITRLVIGDLAFLHDVGSLLSPPDEERNAVQIIVGNDGGGTIFDGLEVAAVASPADFTRVQYTPHVADLGSIARGYGWQHRVVTDECELRAALHDRDPRLVIEVALAR